MMDAVSGGTCRAARQSTYMQVTRGADSHLTVAADRVRCGPRPPRLGRTCVEGGEWDRPTAGKGTRWGGEAVKGSFPRIALDPLRGEVWGRGRWPLPLATAAFRCVVVGHWALGTVLLFFLLNQRDPHPQVHLLYDLLETYYSARRRSSNSTIFSLFYFPCFV